MDGFTLNNKIVTQLLSISRAAGEEILKVYNSDDFGVEHKTDDSPLTKADKAAHNKIMEYLSITGIPTLSEEGADIPYEERKQWNSYWLVDPLDGTKEFIKRNGEFTVNIALIENGLPVFGVVFSPILDKMYYGGTALGYSKIVTNNGNDELLMANSKTESLEALLTKDTVAVVASRSHRNKETEDFINHYKNTELRTMGSSLKFMILAEGNADIYPRFAPTMEWDTAAAHAILLSIGYNVYHVHSENKVSTIPLEYNKKNLLNPSFICF
jgi:3'(2'), 5'-bisphosphate nucleotidase